MKFVKMKILPHLHGAYEITQNDVQIITQGSLFNNFLFI